MPYIEEGETTLYFEKINAQSDKPYLVFLHEGLGCVDLWGNFPKTLCKASGYPGIVFDRIGHGKSSENKSSYTPNYLHKCALFEVPLILDRIVADRPCILIGHSDGGSIALIVASENIPNIKAVVTIAAHTLVEQVTVEGVRNTSRAYNSGKLNRLYELHEGHTERLFGNWSSIWLDAVFCYWSIEYLLPSIKIPVLALQGDVDAYGTEKQVDSIRSASPKMNQARIISNCGHNPHLEYEDVVVSYICKFLEMVNQKSTSRLEHLN